MKRFSRLLIVASLLLLVLSISPAQLALAQDDTIVIESWRNDDLTIWQDVIIPAFNVHYPDIKVVFSPSPPADYNGLLGSKLEAGTAGDLITCRPFDASLTLFNDGYLASLNDLPGMENFSDVAKSAWITDDGSDAFCVPMASVIHGFIYNVDMFNELGLTEPTTEAEFYAVLDALTAAGIEPLVLGTADQWESATVGFQNIGPNYWHGEEGRLGLITGTEKYNAGGFLAAFEALSKWSPYLIDGYQALAYPDAQSAFTLGLGAIYPSGSWEISGFRANSDFELGAFKPPVPEGAEECYISDHTDIALGMNAAIPDAKRENAMLFLEWMTTPEFAALYSNQLPGFFSLSSHEFAVEDELANEFLSWRGECNSTIRASYQILSRGEPNNETDLWLYNAQMLNGDLTAQEAADLVQAGLEAWYEPQMSQ
ncbi:MAG: carbohydrate ABC transporter substrate-binding protein [Anaerolineae bacterium]|nr:carbohydrate ABC transporter substrate-binding protein [Chloroflexota bacterium]MBP6298201.1 carbohydrate ABC transporter substrate-binding protein [Anaerolineae bacterium]